MIDDACFTGICDTLSILDHTRRPNERPSDCFGPMHVLLFGDFKQLPPATSRAPFIIHPRVVREFDFRSLRENRRVVQDESRRDELDLFHNVLTLISESDASNDVRVFVKYAWVRGCQAGCAEDVPFEAEDTSSCLTQARKPGTIPRRLLREAGFRKACCRHADDAR